MVFCCCAKGQATDFDNIPPSVQQPVSNPQQTRRVEAPQPAEYANPKPVETRETIPSLTPPAVREADPQDLIGLYPPWIQKNRNGYVPAGTSAADAVKSNLIEAKGILQKLATLSSTPTIALCEAAEYLCRHLNVSLASIVGFVDRPGSGDGLCRHVLLAAYGTGCNELERTPVMGGEQQTWSAGRLDTSPFLCMSVSTAEQAANLPADWAVLAQSAGMRSFMAVPVTCGKEVYGVLSIAKEQANSFDPDTWLPLMEIISVGLLHHLNNDHVRQVCLLLANLDAQPDTLPFIGLLLRGTHRLLLRSTNIRTGCRIGIMDKDLTRAMIFECDQVNLQDAQNMAISRTTGDSGSGFLMEAPPDVHITELPVANTLLLDAVQKGKARFVSDCALYLQSCMKPAADIFISSSAMVASVVVLPLIYDGATFGGLYFTLEAPSSFSYLKDTLTGFVNIAVLVLARRFHNSIQTIWDSIKVSKDSGDHAHPGGPNGAEGSGNENAVAISNITRPIYVKRSVTEGIMKVLQNEIRKKAAKAHAVEWLTDLVLHEVIGKGGFGMVYKGLFKGSIAAIKVMYAQKHERQAMKDALEMAVLTSVSHPNIIQVYTCFTDMVEDMSGVEGSGVQSIDEPARLQTAFRRLQPEETGEAATCSLLVMEYCDLGSLRQALKKGAFHKRLGSTSVAVDLLAIVQVLLEVAQAVAHLHSLKLLHCDIKPENVLLKSDSTKAIGFTTKLSDFGLAKMLRENQYILNRSGSGTVTHLAPELFQEGSKITTAVDGFSFGIMMWEMYTGQRAYGGLARDAIIDRVYRKKTRPQFPAGVPPLYSSLASGCWDQEPHQRPSFAQILQRLLEMVAAFKANKGTFAD